MQLHSANDQLTARVNMAFSRPQNYDSLQREARDETSAVSGAWEAQEGVRLWCAWACESVRLWCMWVRESTQVMQKARSGVGIRNEREMM
jgi:hypothetical protein